jgi:hypothetical protein
MTETNGKIGTVVVVIAILLVVWLIGNNKVESIKKDMQIGNCFVYEVSVGYKGWKNAYYRAQIGSKEYKGVVTLGIPAESMPVFANHWFPFVYNVNDPDQNRVLIEPSDFKKFGISFPDSLAWLKDYISSFNQ